MKALVQDAETIGALRPLELAAYFRSKGWKHERQIRDKAAIWSITIDGGRAFEVILPLRHDLDDFQSLFD